jgi:glycosyl transferase family 25
VVQAHILEARGLKAGVDPATSIQAVRKRSSLRRENWPFLLRRIGTQVGLARYHLMRLGMARYERTPILDEDFGQVDAHKPS